MIHAAPLAVDAVLAVLLVGKRPRRFVPKHLKKVRRAEASYLSGDLERLVHRDDAATKRRADPATPAEQPRRPTNFFNMTSQHVR